MSGTSVQFSNMTTRLDNVSQAAYQDMAVRFLEDRVNCYCLRLGTQKTSTTSSTSDYTCNVVLEKRAAENHHARVLVVLDDRVHGEQR